MEFEPPDDIELELVESADDTGTARADSGTRDADGLELSFSGELWYWRGPAPYHFITVPHDAARAIQAVAADVTYGWGMIPVRVRIGTSVWATALWPKDGGYVVPIKDAYRTSEGLALGDVAEVQLVVRR
jgi:hypothetical protein